MERREQINLEELDQERSSSSADISSDEYSSSDSNSAESEQEYKHLQTIEVNQKSKIVLDLEPKDKNSRKVLQ